jgi:hypothetical protein
MKNQRDALTHETFLIASYEAQARALMGRESKQQARMFEVAAKAGRDFEPTGWLAGPPKTR